MKTSREQPRGEGNRNRKSYIRVDAHTFVVIVTQEVEMNSLMLDNKYVQWSSFSSEANDVAQIYQWRWLEKSGQWLENADRTHLVLASGKLVLWKGHRICKKLVNLHPVAHILNFPHEKIQEEGSITSFYHYNLHY